MAFGDYDVKTGGMFLKIESGKPQIIRLLQDDPSMKIIHGFGKTAMPCEGEGCIYCLEKDDKLQPTKNAKAKKRFKLNVYSHDQQKVLLWDFGPGVMGLLQDVETSLKLQGVKILETDLIVNAKGELMDKEYSIQAAMKSKPVPEGLVLHPLESKSSGVPF